MHKVLSLLAIIPLLLPLPVSSHGLSPSRIEAPSGSPLVAYRFTASNFYKDHEQFTVQCFKGDLNHPYECKSYPTTFNLAPRKTKTFKVQIQPDSDAVYLVCTLQNKETVLVTRICARFGVGVDPSISTDSDRVRKSTKHPSIPARSGQNKGG